MLLFVYFQIDVLFLNFHKSRCHDEKASGRSFKCRLLHPQRPRTAVGLLLD